MKTLFNFIGLLLKGAWKLITFLRLAIGHLLFLAILAGVYFIYTQSTAPQPNLTTPSALVLNLSGPIVEQPSAINPTHSLTSLLAGQETPQETVLFDLVDTIRHAQQDPNISGIVLALDALPETPLTKLRYVAKALTAFKAAGKPIYAVGDFYNQSQYYLASYADKIFLSPDGAVLLKGYSAYNLYYKTLLDKLDVNTHVFRVGTYKSAIEPFIRNDMSDAARESASRWVNQLWAAYSQDVAENRHFSPDRLSPTMETFLAELKSTQGDLAALSKKWGLVDELATRQQMHQALITQFGANGEGSYNAVDYTDYMLANLTPEPHFDDNNIAVIVASGAIMDGEQTNGQIGGETTAAQLSQARLDNSIKAVVLRVDSPGGSAFASEIIRNEVDALKAAGKPVVVSMSSLAASGGYWISMSADKIVAQPTTLTGSIGIFSVITTFEKSLNKLGVFSDGVGTSPFSGVGVTTGLSDGAAQAMQMGIEHGYHRFISLVGEQRHMSLEQVDAVAQGRVWTGQDALQHGLIDQLGDFDDAVTLAAQLANLQTYHLDWIQEPVPAMQQLLHTLVGEAKVQLGWDISAVLPQTLIPVAQQITQETSLMNSFNDPKGQYALCLNCGIQ